MLGNDKVFIIAEAGVNHNGDKNIAYKLIDAAKAAGADAVKFQTFKAEKMISKHTNMASYQKKNIGQEESQLDMVKDLELSYSDFEELKAYCDKNGIIFLSSPFDEDSIDFLENLIPCYKIPSGEIVNQPYLQHMASKHKPMIMSTGMATLSDVEKALDDIYSVDKDAEIYLLHCTTNYPTLYSEVNLRSMLTLREAFKLPVGYSDHTNGIEIPVAAVAMGACVIEKHFTLDRNMKGPDHKASLEPEDFERMVRAIRNVEDALGNGIKRPTKSEEEMKNVVRKKLVAAHDLERGEIIKRNDVTLKRSNTGLSPEFLNVIVGKRLIKGIKEDEGFSWSHFMEE